MVTDTHTHTHSSTTVTLTVHVHQELIIGRPSGKVSMAMVVYVTHSLLHFSPQRYIKTIMLDPVRGEPTKGGRGITLDSQDMSMCVSTLRLYVQTNTN